MKIKKGMTVELIEKYPTYRPGTQFYCVSVNSNGAWMQSQIDTANPQGKGPRMLWSPQFWANFKEVVQAGDELAAEPVCAQFG